jgi:hypothetical protein
MNNKGKYIVIAGIVLTLAFVGMIVWLIVGNNRQSIATQQAMVEADSLRMANEQLVLANEFNQLQAEFNQFEGQQVYLKDDSLVNQYNEARERVNQLMAELKQEKRSNSANKEKIRQLEAEITTLKGIVKHYLAEIQRLGEENEGLKKEIANVQEKNNALNSQVAETTASNNELKQTVQLAKKLNITGLSLSAYNKKGKSEKNITKATQLGVSFTVSPNNTASPGMKSFYARIISPEGSLLGGGVSCSYDGSNVACTARRDAEYDNNELQVSVYWDVNTTLTPGDYTVEVFCDGYRLGSRHVTMKK